MTADPRPEWRRSARWTASTETSESEIYDILETDDPITGETIPVVIHGPMADPMIDTRSTTGTDAPLSECSHISIRIQMAEREQPLKTETPHTDPWADEMTSEQYYARRRDDQGRLLNDIDMVHTPGTKFIHAWPGNLPPALDPSVSQRMERFRTEIETAIALGLKRLDACRRRYETAAIPDPHYQVDGSCDFEVDRTQQDGGCASPM